MTATPSIDNTNLSIDLITHPTPTSNTEIPSSICYVKQMELELDQELDKMKHSKINDSILIDGTHTNTTTTLPTPITTTHTAAMTTTPGSLKQQQQQLHLQQHIVNPIMNKPLSQQIPMISSLHNPLVHQTPLGIKVQQQQQPMLHPTQKVQQQPVLNNTQLLQQPFLQSTESLKSLTLKATAQPHIAASDKAKNLLVATWLTENYELNGSHSIPRSGLYDHYQSYCLDHRIEPVNSASFGKLIRTVFPNLKTRRLGNYSSFFSFFHSNGHVN